MNASKGISELSEFDPSLPPTPGELATCLPILPDLNWDLIAQTSFFFVGLGAVGRPMAIALAYLGMRRCVLVDPKRYKRQSRVSQCEPNEVDRPKVEVVAELLRRLGVEAAPLFESVEYVPPGHVEPGALVVVSADNRRADITTGRLAAQMRERLVKVNVAPQCLMASIRAYDLRPSPAPLCLECQMTEEQYREQDHPLSCDGPSEQATGSPRALCQLAGQAAALAAAQIVGSPNTWAAQWFGRQWQLLLLGGGAGVLELGAKSDCRWDHAQHWKNLTRLETGPCSTRLCDLAAAVGVPGGKLQLRFSGRVATQARCGRCHQQVPVVRWISRLDEILGPCSCGGSLRAEPFYTYEELPADRLRAVWEVPLEHWGVPGKGILAVTSDGGSRSFVLGEARPAFPV